MSSFPNLEPSKPKSLLRPFREATPTVQPVTVIEPTHKPLTSTTALSQPAEEIVLRPYSDIEPKPVEWLWPSRIPSGALTIFSGDPGLGKSPAAIDIGARVSRGSAWQDGSGNAPLGDVIILACEDSHEHTIRPRLDEAGADCSRVYLLKAETKGTERQFNLKTDVQKLRQVLRAQVKVIVVDPISAYIGDTNDYKDSEVRQMLAPLIKLAADTGIAVIGIKHFNKDSEKTAMQRSSGSIAYVAVARAAWVFVPDPENDSRTLMLMVKTNLGPKG